MLEVAHSTNVFFGSRGRHLAALQITFFNRDKLRAKEKDGSFLEVYEIIRAFEFTGMQSDWSDSKNL